jgi:hypothetical protein
VSQLSIVEHALVKILDSPCVVRPSSKWPEESIRSHERIDESVDVTNGTSLRFTSPVADRNTLCFGYDERSPESRLRLS